MSLENLSAIAAGARAWIRPVGFVDSPQRFDGLTERLAGTLIWFSQIELTVRNPDGAMVRALLPVRNWEEAQACLPSAVAEHTGRLFARLIAPRAPLQLGDRALRLDQPHVMAILNITPDSFSDGGRHVDDVDGAVASAVDHLAAGASIVDVGGESTRPGAKAVWEGDEIARVQPVIERLVRGGNPVSVDTRKATVMEAALAAGAHMINDISALCHDDRALSVAAGSPVPVVLMHAPSHGDNPHRGGAYGEAALDVFDWLEERIDEVVAGGVARDRILVDPGIGFGKAIGDNLSIINNLAMFHALGCPILFGASRKRVIGALSNEAPVDQRLGGSVALVMKAIEQGVQIVRVHDVIETVQAVRVWRGLRDAALTVGA